MAVAHLAARRFEQAIEWADRALHDQPRTVGAMRVKIAANAHLGRLDEARAELSRVLAIDPKLTIAGFRAEQSLYGTRTSRTLRRRPAPGRPTGEVSRRGPASLRLLPGRTGGSIAASRTAGIGASRPLPRVPAKVP